MSMTMWTKPMRCSEPGLASLLQSSALVVRLAELGR